MKKLASTLILFQFLFGYSQTIIRGKVTTTENVPIESASVYLNNTLIGTTTDETGEFELDVTVQGVYELIVSHISYEILQYKIDTSQDLKKIHFQTIPKTNFLDEVVINTKRKEISDEDRSYCLNKFEEAFLGNSRFSIGTTIQNEDVIKFSFNEEIDQISAYSEAPLVIVNKNLGYKYFYDLVDFNLNPEKSLYLGYVRFEELEGNERKKRKWQKNRQIAYKGSFMHFLKSVITNQLDNEGFVLDQMKKEPQHKIPTEKEVEKAKEYLNLLKKNGVHISLDMVNPPKTKVDSAKLLIDRAENIKYKRIVYQNDLKLEDFTENIEGDIHLNFENYLIIRFYYNKKENSIESYRNSSKYQASILTLLSTPEKIIKPGILVNPLSVLVEGYWSKGKVSYMLPLDYNP